VTGIDMDRSAPNLRQIIHGGGVSSFIQPGRDLVLSY